MISNAGDDVKVDENLEKSIDYNAKLDFTSEEFDPLLALKTQNLKPPVATAKMYDNISMYKSAKDKQKKDKDENDSQMKNSKEIVKVSERRWLPHQFPVIRQNQRKRKNLLTFMENVSGPLNVLKMCKNECIKIKVWTRHDHGIRGYCIGYLKAFDKHWNLLLEDVTETWTRKKKRKIPIYNNSNLIGKLKTLPNKYTVVETTKTSETCTRHLDQFVMRGEHVAIINIISNEDLK